MKRKGGSEEVGVWGEGGMCWKYSFSLTSKNKNLVLELLEITCAN